MVLFLLLQACTDYLEFAAAQCRRWQRMMVYEHERRVRLEQMVEQLAKQHSYLEKMARKSLSAVNVGRSGSFKLKKGMYKQNYMCTHGVLCVCRI